MITGGGVGSGWPRLPVAEGGSRAPSYRPEAGVLVGASLRHRRVIECG
jgi:hypothetical protein